jgi:hypothetical protein
MHVLSDSEEELSSYFTYCQDVIFAGNDPDPNLDPVLEIFRGAYEKHKDKVFI